MFKKMGWNKDGKTFGWGESPDADWKVILLSTVVVLILAASWSFYFYTKTENGVVAEGEGVVIEAKTLDIEVLKSTSVYYQNKALEFEKIKSGSSTPVVDPSN